MRAYLLAAALLLAVVVPAHAQTRAQDPAVVSSIDEAFRLAGVRTMLESLPSHINEMTAAAMAQMPNDKRRQLQPFVKDVGMKFLDPDSYYRQLHSYFVKHYDAAHMGTFLALERTPVYRTMHRLDEAAQTPAAQAARRRFEANLQSDPPTPKRIEMLQRLDDARKTTDLEVRIVTGIMNAMTVAMSAEMPSDLDAQSTAFSAKIRPILSTNVLHANLFIYRNTDDADVEDYVNAAQQKDVAWFNRTLQAAILAVTTDRANRAGEYIKSKIAQPPQPPAQHLN